eukprot:4009753-Pyramimonas_sp.AAC.1
MGRRGGVRRGDEDIGSRGDAGSSYHELGHDEEGQEAGRKPLEGGVDMVHPHSVSLVAWCTSP